jgi:3-hydroxyisobutyrate dehydrogenase-like beta-hydroxyacid dehydrogenase
MGAAVGTVVRTRGHRALWVSEGRSAATVERASAAGLEDAESVDELAARCDVIISLCPPHAAVDVARSATGFSGIYVDANAVSPATARSIAELHPRFVDGGIVGPPPHAPGTSRLYLSGEEAALVAGLFTGTALEPVVVSTEAGAASAVKMTYAAWSKGTAALALAIRALARAERIEQTLLREWETSQPRLRARSEAAARSAAAKAWRWVGEMNEIADTFAAAGLPDGFHRAAAEIFERTPHEGADGTVDPEDVLAALQRNAP